MDNELLITEEDFKKYRPLPAQGFRFDELFPFILEAQRGWLRKTVLGEELYYAMEQNRTTSPYPDLINGVAYTYEDNTVYYYGLVPALVYYSWALFMRGNNMKITRSGNKTKSKSNSEDASAELQAAEYNKAMNNALMYANEVRRYLQKNNTTYPLYEPSQSPQGAISVVNVTRPKVVLDEGDDTRSYTWI